MNELINNTVILIVTHNHEEYVKKLIDSCKTIREIPKYFCDAASKDNTLEILINETKDCSDFFILSKANLESFSKNNNDLIRKFKLLDKNILLINPDCFFKTQSLRDFVVYSQSIEGLGVLAPELHFPDGSKQITWRKYPSILEFFFYRVFNRGKVSANHYIYKYPDKSIFIIEWALGAFLYVSKEFIKKNNGLIFDERYRLYCEDADLCLTAYAHELKVLGITQDGIYHALQEKSTSKFSKYNYWNIMSGVKFMFKWWNRYKLLTNKMRVLVKQ